MKRTPLKRQSSSSNAKQKRAKYSEAKKVYMENRDKVNCCEACEKNIGKDFLDLHHKAGRAGTSINEVGEHERNLTNKMTFMAVCRPCHNWIHAHPKESRELGWLM